MKTRDIVLLATFVNAAILGLLLLLSKEKEEVIAVPLGLVKEETKIVEAEPLLIAPHVEPTPDLQPVVPQEEWYVMKSGDNPWKVAKNNKIKFDDLLKLNGLNEERARNLKPGDRIRIR